VSETRWDGGATRWDAGALSIGTRANSQTSARGISATSLRNNKQTSRR